MDQDIALSSSEPPVEDEAGVVEESPAVTETVREESPPVFAPAVRARAPPPPLRGVRPPIDTVPLPPADRPAARHYADARAADLPTLFPPTGGALARSPLSPTRLPSARERFDSSLSYSADHRTLVLFPDHQSHPAPRARPSAESTSSKTDSDATDYHRRDSASARPTAPSRHWEDWFPTTSWKKEAHPSMNHHN